MTASNDPATRGLDDGDPGSGVPPQVRLNQLLSGYFIGRAIQVAAELGVADALAEGSRDTADVAASVGAEPQALYRLLRALAAVGLFREVEPARFSLTPVGACLCSDVPGSLRALARFHGSDLIRRSYDSLAESVRTGKPVSVSIFGTAPFTYLEEHPEAQAVFDSAMTSASSMDNAAVIAAYNFAGVHTILDVGGGRGGLLAAVLSAHPTLRGILFDRPVVVEAARQELARAGLMDRCDVLGGDFFEAVPTGADIYLLKNVLHDWDDERAVAILRSCRQAIKPTGRLLVIDPLIPPGDEPSPNKTLDLMMLTVWGGRERTAAEFREMMRTAAFTLTRVVSTASRVAIVEAVPA